MPLGFWDCPFKHSCAPTFATWSLSMDLECNGWSHIWHLGTWEWWLHPWMSRRQLGPGGLCGHTCLLTWGKYNLNLFKTYKHNPKVNKLCELSPMRYNLFTLIFSSILRPRLLPKVFQYWAISCRGPYEEILKLWQHWPSKGSLRAR